MIRCLLPCVLFLAAQLLSSAAYAQAEATDNFRRLDRNKDGKLTLEEVPQGLRAVFDRMDTNKDAILTRAEFDAFQAQADRRRDAQRMPLKPTHADVR